MNHRKSLGAPGAASAEQKALSEEVLLTGSCSGAMLRSGLIPILLMSFPRGV